MHDGSQFIDIIFFAMAAVFLGLRLYSVLGRRTGNERPPGGFGGISGRDGMGRDGMGEREAGERGTADNVVDLNNRRRSAPPVELPELPPGPDSLDGRLAQIRAADPAFTEESFIRGAAGAFEIIVGAFARGDEAALRPLLSDEVFEHFSQAIHGRRAAGESCESRLVRLEDVSIEDARLDGRTARITVRFQSRQIIMVKDAEGRIVEGDPGRDQRIIDLWSFARDTRRRDPNWLLVATDSHDL